MKHPYDWKIVARGQGVIYSPPTGQAVSLGPGECVCVCASVHMCVKVDPSL